MKEKTEERLNERRSSVFIHKQSTSTNYMWIEEFTPNDDVVFHCCQSDEIVAAESVEIFGVVGQNVGSYHPHESGTRPSVAL